MYEIWYPALLQMGEAMKRAVPYLRVSTLEQTTANQERELRQVAERAGWRIVRVYKDHRISGAKGKDKRPEFDAPHKAAARREFDVVIDTTSPGGKAMFQMLGVFAEFERSIIQERVRAGLRRAKAEGKQLGRPRLAPELEARILAVLKAPGRKEGVRKIAKRFGVDPGTVQRISGAGPQRGRA
jgi:DNA invertase Pin-like site-specific DNA recombinase